MSRQSLVSQLEPTGTNWNQLEPTGTNRNQPEPTLNFLLEAAENLPNMVSWYFIFLSVGYDLKWLSDEIWEEEK